MSAEETLQQGEPQHVGDFLFRVVLIATPLSIALAILPALVVALPSVRLPPLSDVFVGLLFFIVGAAWLGAISIFVATIAVALIGAPLWRLFNCDETWTRPRATQLGAVAGAIIALIEVAYLFVKLVSGPSYIPDGFNWSGLAFGTDGAPSAITWVKLTVDVALTIGIGAFSARAAWRPPKPPSETTHNPQSSPSPPPQ